MKNAIKRMILASGAVALSAWLGVGCSSESLPEPKGDEITAEKQADGRYLLRMATPPDEAIQSPDGTPGESADGDADKAANCVYVQWCNEPGPSGTICRLRSGCYYNSATVDECIRDTYYVCGAPVQPWYLF